MKNILLRLEEHSLKEILQLTEQLLGYLHWQYGDNLPLNLVDELGFSSGRIYALSQRIILINQANPDALTLDVDALETIYEYSLMTREPVCTTDLTITCVGCGCRHYSPCHDEHGHACYWLKIDEINHSGVCSACEEHLPKLNPVNNVWPDEVKQIFDNLAEANILPAAQQQKLLGNINQMKLDGLDSKTVAKTAKIISQNYLKGCE